MASRRVHGEQAQAQRRQAAQAAPDSGAGQGPEARSYPTASVDPTRTTPATWISDLRGLAKLSVDGALGITDVVERLHATIQATRLPLGASTNRRTRGITGLVYRAVRTGMQWTGVGIDLALTPFTASLPHLPEASRRDWLLAIMNGTHGDHLAQTGNPLAIAMSLRHEGQPIALSAPVEDLSRRLGRAPRAKLLICIHGLCMNDHQWLREGYSHGTMLAEAACADVLYLRYNTGLPIHRNGADLARQLESLLQAWQGPVPELVLIGHSMGGLVARSAYHQAALHKHRWPEQLRQMFFLGSPHHGAPLERGGAMVDQILGVSPYASPFAKIGQSRSAGIQDLRYGTLIEGDPLQSVSLPKNVRCYAIAARLDSIGHDAADTMVGDGLVPLASALGVHAERKRHLGIPKHRQKVIPGIGHLALLWDQEVGATLRDWLRSGA